MTLLEAINRVLIYGGGFRQVNSVTDTMAVRAKVVIDDTLRDFLTAGYGFNIDTIDLNRDNAGVIKLPDSYLQVELPEPFIVREGKVYDPSSGKRTYNLDRDFKETKVSLLLTIDQLPEVAAQLVSWRAAESFCVATRSGQSAQLQWVRDKHNQASVRLSCEFPQRVQNNLNWPGYGGAPTGRYGTCRWVSCC